MSVEEQFATQLAAYKHVEGDAIAVPDTYKMQRFLRARKHNIAKAVEQYAEGKKSNKFVLWLYLNEPGIVFMRLMMMTIIIAMTQEPSWYSQLFGLGSPTPWQIITT